eukprot:scaffold1921_cov74-Cyclotella_meneghiniana.AAC.3
MAIRMMDIDDGRQFLHSGHVREIPCYHLMSTLFSSSGSRGVRWLDSYVQITEITSTLLCKRVNVKSALSQLLSH